MNSSENRQQENVTKAKLIANLISLKQTYGFKSYQLAKRLEIGESYLSSVVNGSKEASEQLSAAVEILLELEQLKKTLEEKDAAIAEFEREKEYLRNLFRPQPPFSVNEPSSTAADRARGEVVDVIDEAKRRAAALKAKRDANYKARRGSKKKPGA